MIAKAVTTECRGVRHFRTAEGEGYDETVKRAYSDGVEKAKEPAAPSRLNLFLLITPLVRGDFSTLSSTYSDKHA